jgi:hypothetical protein
MNHTAFIYLFIFYFIYEEPRADVLSVENFHIERTSCDTFVIVCMHMVQKPFVKCLSLQKNILSLSYPSYQNYAFS